MMRDFIGRKLRIPILWLALVCPAALYAQQHVVTGTVYGDTGEGLPGVNVVLKNTTIGAITDVDGNFSITVPNAQAALVFTFIGYETAEEIVGDRVRIEVTLTPSATSLNEVVVTAMGIESETKSLGYAVGRVSGEDIGNSSEVNILNALAGKVAGLQISSSSGGVGSSTRMTLRGISSLGGNSQPLLVIDGVPVNNSSVATGTVDWGSGVNELNPQDVAEVVVLKGASAAALYGSRAANGAIVITTKSGAPGKGFGIDFTSSLTLSKPLRLPDYQNDYGEGVSTTEYDYWRLGSSTASFGPELDAGLYFVQLGSPMLRNEDGDILYGDDGLPLFQPIAFRSYKNNVKDFFNTGKDLTNTISVSRSEDHYNFRLSYTHLKQAGMIPTTDFTKNDLGLNAGVKINKKISLGGNIQYHTGYSDNRNYMNNYAMNPVKSVMFMPRSADINLLKQYASLEDMDIPLPSFVHPGEYEGVLANSYDKSDYFPNPYFTLDHKKLMYDYDRLFSVITAKVNILPWLKFDGRYAKEIITRTYEDRSDKGVRNWTGSVWSYAGYYKWNSYQYDNTTANFFLTASKQMGDFNLTAFGGAERYSIAYTTHGIYVPELTVPGLFNVSNAAGDVQSSNYYSEKRVNSIFGSATLSYHDALFLEVTGRNDWSSTLPASNRSYFYPSARLSAIMNELMTLPGIISMLKLRTSITRVGNDTSPYQLQPSITNRNQIGGVYEATVENSLKNPQLKPERSDAFEVGMELALLNGRVSGDITYFTRATKDQILSATVSPTSGYSSRLVNVGQINNKGLEVQLSYRPIQRKELTWEITGTYTRIRNEVVELADGVDQYSIGSGIYSASSKAIVGQPFGVIYGYAFQRDPDGNIIHVNGLPQSTDETQPLGNIMPDWLGSVGTTVNYKAFTFSTLIDMKIGGDLQSASVQWLRMNGLVKETNNAALRESGVVGKGVMNVGTSDNPVYAPNNVAVSAATYSQAANDYYLDESCVFDASYVKLREMRLSYRLPKALLERLPIQKVLFGITARNLAILYSNVPHIDPETSLNATDSGQGWEVFNIPSARTVNFSLSIGL